MFLSFNLRSLQYSFFMKKTVFLFAFLLTLMSCGQNSKHASSQQDDETVVAEDTVGYASAKYGATKIVFAETEVDFGSYGIQEERTHSFAFTNGGNSPLVIEKAQTSCSCTVIDYPHEPIMPGKGGEVKITYRARQKRGHFHRNVYVYSNGSEQPVRLIISGEQH